MRVWFSKCSACNNEWSCVSIKKYKLTHICGILFPARHIIVRNELHDFTKVYLLCNLIYILCQTYRNSNCDQNSTIENDWKTWIPNKTKQNEKKQKPQHMNSFRNSNLQFSLLWGKKIHSKRKIRRKKCNELFQVNFQDGSWKIYSFFFPLNQSTVSFNTAVFYWNCHFFLPFAEKKKNSVVFLSFWPLRILKTEQK